jgi:hypothetical protein
MNLSLIDLRFKETSIFVILVRLQSEKNTQFHTIVYNVHGETVVMHCDDDEASIPGRTTAVFSCC